MHTSILVDLLVRLPGREGLLDVMGACPAKDDDIEEGIGTKTVCTVDRDRGSLAGSVETRDDLVVAVLQDDDECICH